MLDDLAQRDRLAALVRNLNAYGVLAGDGGLDTHGQRLEGQGDVVVAGGDGADFDARRGLEFKHGDHGAGDDLLNLALDVEIRQAGGELTGLGLQGLGVGSGLLHRGFVQKLRAGQLRAEVVLGRGGLLRRGRGLKGLEHHVRAGGLRGGESRHCACAGLGVGGWLGLVGACAQPLAQALQKPQRGPGLCGLVVLRGLARIGGLAAQGTFAALAPLVVQEGAQALENRAPAHLETHLQRHGAEEKPAQHRAPRVQKSEGKPDNQLADDAAASQAGRLAALGHGPGRSGPGHDAQHQKRDAEPAEQSQAQAFRKLAQANVGDNKRPGQRADAEDLDQDASRV